MEGNLDSSSTISAGAGNCEVCGDPAKTRCASCRLAFYCGRAHQKKHWSTHKSSCRCYEVASSHELGRHLLANRDLQTGDLILSEAPIIWGPTPHTDGREKFCVGCGAEDAWARCPQCAWPACKANCAQLKAEESPHAAECALLQKAKLLPRCEYLLILRVLILRSKHPKRWSILEKLQSHEGQRGPGTDAHEEMRMIAQYFGPLVKRLPEHVLPKVCGLIDVNALETNPPSGSAALYETACLLEHNCLANTRHTFEVDEKGRPRINVIAVCDIKKGDHLSTTYTHVLWSTRARREHLLDTKYFGCNCIRCADPTELGSHLGSLKCPCGKGWMTPENPLLLRSDWSCNECPGALSALEVFQLTDRLAEEVDNAMSVADKNIMLDLLFRLNVLLHPCHQHCLTIGHSLLQLLPPDDPKKVELCTRIIDTIQLIDPYEARLPIYKSIALRELSKCPGQDKRSLLMKAVELLRHEPPKSPGELLAKVILSEI